MVVNYSYFKWKKGGEAQYLESFLRFAPFFPLEDWGNKRPSFGMRLATHL
jgi:hypothetical protein